MIDMDYEQERAELEQKFQKFARENPDHPAVIEAIAGRIATSKGSEPSECVRDWLALALVEPNDPRVLRVRKLVADRAANRERRRNGPVFIEPFRLPLHMENVPWDAQQRQQNGDNVPSNPKPAQEAERLYPVLSKEQKEGLFDDLAENLRITKAFKLFGEMNSGNSKIN